jgi:hypothetical protein
VASSRRETTWSALTGGSPLTRPSTALAASMSRSGGAARRVPPAARGDPRPARRAPRLRVPQTVGEGADRGSVRATGAGPMRRLLLAVLACTTLLLPALVANAASLGVSASVLQVVHVDGLPKFELPSPGTVDVTVSIREFAGSSGNPGDTRDLGPYSIAAGSQYYIAYTGGQTRPCPDTIGSPQQTGGPFTVNDAGLHVLCVQKAQDGTVTVRTGSVDGPIVAPTVQASGTTSPTGTALHSDETDEQSEPTAQEHEDDGSTAPDVTSVPLEDDQPPQRESSEFADPAAESGR